LALWHDSRLPAALRARSTRPRCGVGYYAANDIIVCPCHGSEFEMTTGDVMNAPAPHGLTKLKIVEGSNGNLYLQ
jgi:thiosulfate dehydrogenase [quinone] large subunit